MIFNGLSKSDLVIYNALADMLQIDPSGQISISRLADKSQYDERTVMRSLRRLVDWRMINRRRDKNGVPYQYHLLEE